MKLLKYFGIASMAIAAPDERVFSDNDNFLNEKHDWWTDETTVEQMDLMKELTPGVIRHYFKSVPALKENFLKRFEKLTRNMESHNERCERKNASGRKRRDANDEERFLMAGITSKLTSDPQTGPLTSNFTDIFRSTSRFLDCSPRSCTMGNPYLLGRLSAPGPSNPSTC